mmetsp:Transcript_49377/g.130982  ORF Transcript_49377/g.130982 Transcript_49377/m.130982 type:complete len:326 (+) Transcript_49377:697-1674(+)
MRVSFVPVVLAYVHGTEVTRRDPCHFHGGGCSLEVFGAKVDRTADGLPNTPCFKRICNKNRGVEISEEDAGWNPESPGSGCLSVEGQGCAVVREVVEESCSLGIVGLGMHRSVLRLLSTCEDDRVCVELLQHLHSDLLNPLEPPVPLLVPHGFCAGRKCLDGQPVAGNAATTEIVGVRVHVVHELRRGHHMHRLAESSNIPGLVYIVEISGVAPEPEVRWKDQRSVPEERQSERQFQGMPLVVEPSTVRVEDQEAIGGLSRALNAAVRLEMRTVGAASTEVPVHPWRLLLILHGSRCQCCPRLKQGSLTVVTTDSVTHKCRQHET